MPNAAVAYLPGVRWRGPKMILGQKTLDAAEIFADIDIVKAKEFVGRQDDPESKTDGALRSIGEKSNNRLLELLI